MHVGTSVYWKQHGVLHTSCHDHPVLCCCFIFGSSIGCLLYKIKITPCSSFYLYQIEIVAFNVGLLIEDFLSPESVYYFCPTCLVQTTISVFKYIHLPHHACTYFQIYLRPIFKISAHSFVYFVKDIHYQFHLPRYSSEKKILTLISKIFFCLS